MTISDLFSFYSGRLSICLPKVRFIISLIGLQMYVLMSFESSRLAFSSGQHLQKLPQIRSPKAERDGLEGVPEIRVLMIAGAVPGLVLYVRPCLLQR